MNKLTTKEEEIMQVLWKLKKAFVKEVVAELPKPKPHYNTVSTVIRKMEDKGFIKHESFGNTHLYYPAISKEDYRTRFFSNAIHNYFEDSYKNVVSFFAKENDMDMTDFQSLMQHVGDDLKEDIRKAREIDAGSLRGDELEGFEELDPDDIFYQFFFCISRF